MTRADELEKVSIKMSETARSTENCHVRTDCLRAYVLQIIVLKSTACRRSILQHAGTYANSNYLRDQPPGFPRNVMSSSEGRMASPIPTALLHGCIISQYSL